MKKLTKKDIILIEGKRWFDKINGNTYHSTTLYVNNEEKGCSGMVYGYGEQYRYTGLKMLKTIYNASFETTREATQELNIMFTVIDGLKRELGKHFINN